MKYPTFKTHTDAHDIDTVVYEDGQNGAMLDAQLGYWEPYQYDDGAEIELSGDTGYTNPYDAYKAAVIIFNQ